MQRDLNNRNYFEFEFTSKSSKYTRHSLAVVAAANGEGGVRAGWAGACRAAGTPPHGVLMNAACATGKFYTMTTGANERRWGKVKDRLETSVRSFQLLF